MRLSPQDAAAPLDLPLAAVTGATGFIGRHLVAALIRRLAGASAAAARTRVPEWRDLPPPQVVAGALDDTRRSSAWSRAPTS